MCVRVGGDPGKPQVPYCEERPGAAHCRRDLDCVAGWTSVAALPPRADLGACGHYTIGKEISYLALDHTSRSSHRTSQSLSVSRPRSGVCAAPALRRGVHCTCARSVPGLGAHCAMKPTTGRSARCGLVHESRPATLPAKSHWWDAVTMDTSCFVVAKSFPSDSQSCTIFECTVQLVVVLHSTHLPLRAERI